MTLGYILFVSLSLAGLLVAGMPFQAPVSAQAPIVLDIQIADGADDATADNFDGTGWSLGFSSLRLGDEWASRVVGLRFRGLNIPPGAIILSSYVSFASLWFFENDNCYVTIRAEVNPNPAPFSTWGDFNSRVLTPNQSEWGPIEHWSDRVWSNSSSLNSILQAVAANGINDLVLRIDNNGSTTNAKRNAYSYDSNPAYAPILHIEYVAEEFDDTPPIISNIQVSEVTQDSAVISWTTDDYSDSALTYGKVTPPGILVEGLEITQSHSFLLTGLERDTTYYFTVSSCNTSGYCSQSPIYQFTTFPVDLGTAIGDLELASTFHCISVYSNFTGDDNSNNTIMVEYREAGTSGWIEVGSFIVDRRETLVYGAGTVDNPFKYQWRGSIVGLSPNTQYEVRATYSDPDGVNGTNPVVGSIWTRNDVILLGTGNVYYVATDGSDTPGGGSEASPWRTIQYAADRVSAGDTVYIKAGTYNEQVDIAASGTADNYITFQNYGTDTVIIDGGNSRSNNFSFSGISYVKVSGLILKKTTAPNIMVTSSSKNIVIEDNTISDGGGGYRGNVQVQNGSEGTVIRNNDISQAKSVSEPFAIRFDDTEGGNIVYGNTISGNFFDGIGGAVQCITCGPYRDSDIYDNIITAGWDDGIEIDGGGINIRIWGNVVTSPYGVDIISWAPTVVGPTYIFRNVFSGAESGAFKIGGGGSYESTGHVFIYHNTVYGTDIAVLPWGNTSIFDNQTYRNNIYQTSSWGISCLASDSSNGAGNSFDYDNFGTSYNVARWDHIQYTGADGLADFYAATGFEEHGMDVDSQFVDSASGDVTLQSTSPVIDQGVVLLGFNDVNSAWPYKGAAPDMGAFEYGSGPLPSLYLTVESEYGEPEGEGWYDSSSIATFSVPSIVDHGDGSRHVFLGWSGDSTATTPSASVTMDRTKTVGAKWKLQYRLNVESARGDPQGEGWHDRGSMAEIRVKSPLGMIVRKVFNGWSGDSAADTSVAGVLMDRPKTVTANWRTDYIQLYILIGGVIALAGTASSLMFVRRKMRRT